MIFLRFNFVFRASAIKRSGKVKQNSFGENQSITKLTRRAGASSLQAIIA
jgi:hypothetical protein